MWNALSISSTAAVDILLLKFRLTWSSSLIYWSVVLWSDQSQTHLHVVSFFPQCFWIALKISFSNTLPTVGKRLTGRKFGGNFECLLGFSRVMNFASFQGDGKWPSWRQCLDKCVKCTKGLPERFWGHSLPNIKDGIYFEMLQSRKFIDVSYSAASTWASTRRLWWQSHKPSALNWFSKKPAFFGFIDWVKYGIYGTMNCRCCLWSIHFVRYFAIGRITWSVTFHSPLTLFPIFQVLFSGQFSWYFKGHSLRPFFMLDPWFLAIISWAFFCESIKGPSQVFRTCDTKL
jgi:hypothetical protein